MLKINNKEGRDLNTMASNLITIFNRLTSSELADYNIFSEILENHYEKFKYFYSLIDGVDLDKVEQIYARTGKNSLRITIEPHEIQYINDIVFTINKNRNNYTFSDHFTINMVESSGCLLIEIGMQNNKKEKSVYASRFV